MPRELGRAEPRVEALAARSDSGASSRTSLFPHWMDAKSIRSHDLACAISSGQNPATRRLRRRLVARRSLPMLPTFAPRPGGVSHSPVRGEAGAREHHLAAALLPLRCRPLPLRREELRGDGLDTPVTGETIVQARSLVSVATPPRAPSEGTHGQSAAHPGRAMRSHLRTCSRPQRNSQVSCGTHAPARTASPVPVIGGGSLTATQV